MRRVDVSTRGDLSADPAHRPPLGSGKRFGELRSEEIGPADAAEEEGAAGEERDVCSVYVDGEGDVVRRVTGGVEDAEPAEIGGDLGHVADLACGEVDVHPLRDDILGLRPTGEFEAPAHVVVVEVGLEDVGCAPPVPVKDFLDAIDVALRIDDDGGRSAADDVTAIAEVRSVDRDDLQAAHWVTTVAPAAARSSSPPLRL